MSANESGNESRSSTEMSGPTQKILPVCEKLLSESAKTVSKEFVFDVYDQIAPHFSHTRYATYSIVYIYSILRYKMWPRVAEFVNSLPSGAFFMDAGCGNGKNLMSASHLVRFGSDRSHPFCEMARTNGKCDAIQADISRDIGKAFRPSIFDAVIAIAVIHHIPDVVGRLASLRELYRMLKPNGRALVYVWAMEQKKGTIGARTFESQDIYVPWNLQSKYLKPDSGIPEGQIVPLKRYYHVFTEEEFRGLLEQVPEFRVEGIYYDSNNWGAELVAIKD